MSQPWDAIAQRASTDWDNGWERRQRVPWNSQASIMAMAASDEAVNLAREVLIQAASEVRRLCESSLASVTYASGSSIAEAIVGPIRARAIAALNETRQRFARQVPVSAVKAFDNILSKSIARLEREYSAARAEILEAIKRAYEHATQSEAREVLEEARRVVRETREKREHWMRMASAVFGVLAGIWTILASYVNQAVSWAGAIVTVAAIAFAISTANIFRKPHDPL